MNTSNAIFKFVTIRNATNELKTQPKLEIQPVTAIVKALIKIIESDKKQPEKIKEFNQISNDFIKSKDFYKTKLELTEVANKIFPRAQSQIETTAHLENATEIKNFYENLYNNIVVRTITKSNTTEVFKLLTDTIKIAYQKLNSEKVAIEKIRIVLPEGLIFSFYPPKVNSVKNDNNNLAENAALLAKIQDLHKQKETILKSKEENDRQISIEQKKIFKQQNEIVAQQNLINQEKTSTPKNIAPVLREISTDAIDKLLASSKTFEKTDGEINRQLTELNHQAFQLIPQIKYVRIGEKWVDVTRTESEPPIIEDDPIFVYPNNCDLKFPFQVADLRVVEQKTVGYLPAEIAHINNTQAGEKQEKITRRLKRVETFDALITEDEVSKETDTQSTEKFSIEKAASDVQSEENSINVNASVSGTYGVVTASLDAGFSHTQSSQNSNSSSQSYAKEIVQKVVDRVSHKVKSERSIKTLEEFEETVTHIIDNSGNGPKSYVYRWLMKLVRATLKNYGKRLIFQIDVAHPSAYYLSRAIQGSKPLNIPPDPRDLRKENSDPIIKDFYQKTKFPFYFSVYDISPQNYLAWAELYHAKLEQPPQKKMIVGYMSALKDGAVAESGKGITIPTGYLAKKANIVFYYRKLGADFLIILIGRNGVAFWDILQPNITAVTTIQLDDETGILPITILQFGSGYNLNVEIDCEPDEATFTAWKIKCYQAIIEAYENLKSEAESKMSDFNPNNPGINPSRKNELIRTELKKGTLSKMFRCKPFWITDNYTVGKEYTPDCCKDSLNAEQARFLETVFDWQNMTYELYPYFYGDKDNWADLLNLSDDDPHFEAFLQASYATVRIPVHRDSQKEIAAINFILLNKTIANYDVIPASMKYILDDLESNTPFGYSLDNPDNADFKEIKKEYDKTGNLIIFYEVICNSSKYEVICTEKTELDKEGNQTKFYYDPKGQLVISEIKEGIDSNGQKYSYYFNAHNDKVVCHKTQIEYDISGNATPFYSTDLGIFPIPTDLVILEAGVENGVELRGYPEDISPPTSDVIIPKQYSPAIIKK